MVAPRTSHIPEPTGGARVHRLRSAADVGDEELVLRAREGDGWAKEALYRRHVHRVTAVAARLLRVRADVEDVVQDTFAEAFRDLASLREPARIGAWLARSVVNRIHKRFRRRKLQRFLGLDRSFDDETLADQAREDASQEARAELVRLDRALQSAGDHDRTAWVLRHLLGFQVAEVADATAASLATVHRRLARAQQIVDRHFGSGDDA